MESIETEVVVVGAGPVGLVLAGDLGWRGRRCVVLERTDGAIGQPKMDQVGIRTMEFCRRWGIVDRVEASAYVRSYPQDNVYLTSLNGYELGREVMPSMNELRPPLESPQHRERCPQNMFDPILRHFASEQAGVDIRYGLNLKSFVQDERGVTAEAVDGQGRPVTVRAKYLVGCDGGRSRVRNQLGIAMRGRGLLTNTVNVVFRSVGFNERHDKRPGYRYMFVGPDGIWATLVAINGSDQWRMSIIGNAQEQPEYTVDEIRRYAYQLLGKEFPLDILSVLYWARIEQVADSYQSGRVFLAGDACHLTSPTGGLGMNTGIGDAVDLSWKLAAQLQGWGGPRLIDSYTIERKPVAHRITRFSSGNLDIMRGAKSDQRLFKDGPEGDEVRARVGHALEQGLKREWYSMNMHLGVRYMDSPVCVYSEVEDRGQVDAQNEQGSIYAPSTKPGSRAPHAWLKDGRSTLDLFGRSFVLFSHQAVDDGAARMTRAADAMGIPFDAVSIEEPEVAALYERPYVLVRPDGHVAWRGERIPTVAGELLGQVVGLAPDGAGKAAEESVT